MFGSVMVMGFPATICSTQSGITEPLLAITLPYLVQQTVVLAVSPNSLPLAQTTFSISALLMPIALTG